jgi:hypothetical protein
MRFEVEIDGQKVVSNYPTHEPIEFSQLINQEQKEYSLAFSENMKLLPREKREGYIDSIRN